MTDIFLRLHPAIQALVATFFTWGMTALGALPVLFFRNVPRRLTDCLLAFAGGVMLAASCWSLIIPALDQAAGMGMEPVSIVVGGFLTGGLVMRVGERLSDLTVSQMSGKLDTCSRTLMFSITLHNIPEGLCVGVAFGAAALEIPGATVAAAAMLTLGIGIQNLPEGAAVSLPIVRSGISRSRAFFMGQLSGVVESVAGVTGALMVLSIRPLLPFMLAFAAGAMIYAVAGEIFPESRSDAADGGSAMYAVAGFAIMMGLDTALT